MVALGTLSLLQVCFAPGYLLLKMARWEARSILQSVVYTFALSLIINYSLVYLLTAFGAYNSTVIYGLMISETALGLWLWRKHGFSFRSRGDLSRWAERQVEIFGLRHISACVVFGLAIASLYVFARVFYSNLGSIFNQWDDVNSWD